MSVACQEITIPEKPLLPAKITAVAPFSASPAGYDSINVDITWQNIGEQTGSFVPRVLIAGIAVDLGGVITLAPGETHRISTTVAGVKSGVKQICPFPN